jgi:hypothetical protein
LIQNYGFVVDTLQILPLNEADYLLGVADLTGELMRYCINAVGKGRWAIAERVCQTMSKLTGSRFIVNIKKIQLDSISISDTTVLKHVVLSFIDSQFSIHELGKKLVVAKQSLSKVETGKNYSLSMHNNIYLIYLLPTYNNNITVDIHLFHLNSILS